MFTLTCNYYKPQFYNVTKLIKFLFDNCTMCGRSEPSSLSKGSVLARLIALGILKVYNIKHDMEKTK